MVVDNSDSIFIHEREISDFNRTNVRHMCQDLINTLHCFPNGIKKKTTQ